MSNVNGTITSFEGAWTIKNVVLYGSDTVEDFSSACKWEDSSSAYVEGTKAVHKLALRKLPTETAAASAVFNSFASERYDFWQSLRAA